MWMMKRLKWVAALVALMAAGAGFAREIALDLRTAAPGAPLARTLAADAGLLRSAMLEAGAADAGALAPGDALSVALFDDVTVELTLTERLANPLGGEVYLAEVAGYEGVKSAVAVRTAAGLTLDIQDFLRKRVYRVVSSAAGVRVEEIDTSARQVEPCRECRPKRTPEGAERRAKASVSAAPAGGVSEVDILVAYDEAAFAWAEFDGGGMEVFAAMSVAKMNAALANTGLDELFRFRLVGVEYVPIQGGDDLGAVLNEVTNAAFKDGEYREEWAAVAAARDRVGADIVTVLVDTGSADGSVGIGWSLGKEYGDSIAWFGEQAYNVCAVRAVAEGHTMTHEVGHNMGAGHATEVNPEWITPGPQLYGYSAGHYFTGADDNVGYFTIMAYNYDGFENYYASAPFFSSPGHFFHGTAVGDALHDNTRTLRNTCRDVAKFRAKVVEDELGVPEWTIENGVLTGVALNGMAAVVVPSSVRTIGAGAFQHLDALVRIRVPGNVKTIEAQAFAWCSSLVDVSLEEGVEAIGAMAFAGAPFQTMVLPKTIATIDAHAFQGCSELYYVSLPESLRTRYGEDYFRDVVFAGCRTDLVLDFYEVPTTAVLTFDKNDGSGVAESVTCDLGTTTRLPTADELGWTREGYAFLGWGISAGETAASDVWYYGGDDIDVVEDLTLYAVWQDEGEATHTAFFFPNDGVSYYYTWTQVTGQLVDGALTWELPRASELAAIFGRDLADFLGWSTDRYATEPMWQDGDTISTTGDVELYAVWQVNEDWVSYTVALYPNGGAYSHNIIPMTVQGAFADRPFSIELYPVSLIYAQLPTFFPRPQEDFLGWSTDPEAATPMYGDGATVEVMGNMELYAVWAGTRATYYVDFYPNDGSGLYVNDYAFTGFLEEDVLRVTLPLASTFGFQRPLEDFLGWTTDPAAETPMYADGDVVPLTGDTTLYAVWAPQTVFVSCTITLSKAIGDGEPLSATRLAGQESLDGSIAWTLPSQDEVAELFPAAGDTLVGWSRMEGDTAPEFAPGDSVTLSEDCAFYAVYDATRTYAVQMVKNDPDFLWWDADDPAHQLSLSWEATTRNGAPLQWTLPAVSSLWPPPSGFVFSAWDVLADGQNYLQRVSDGAAIALRPGVVYTLDAYWDYVLPGARLTLDCYGVLLRATVTDAKEVVLPGRVRFVMAGSFRGVTGLEAVEIPETVVEIGSSAFAGCSGLKCVTFRGDCPSFIDDDSFDGLSPDCVFTLPRSSVATYEAGGRIAKSGAGYVWNKGGYAVVLSGKPDIRIEGDEGAEISGDETTGYVIKPSAGTAEVVVAIPEGVAPADVTVEVPATAERVRPNGARVKIMHGDYDLTPHLRLPAPGSDGGYALADAEVRREVVEEAMDTDKGAVFDMKKPTAPKLKTANTKPGLTYTLVEGRTPGTMATGESKLGDGTPFEPTPTIKGGKSAFYSIRVNLK